MVIAWSAPAQVAEEYGKTWLSSEEYFKNGSIQLTRLVPLIQVLWFPNFSLELHEVTGAGSTNELRGVLSLLESCLTVASSSLIL